MDSMSIKVMPNVSEYGVVGKEVTGVMDRGEGLPEALKPMQRTLAQIAQRLGVDMNKRPDEMVVAFEVGMQRRTAQRTPEANRDTGLSLG